MPTKATPADTFDLEGWLASPLPRAPLGKFTIHPLDTDRPLTVVMRGQNGDDHEALSRARKAAGADDLTEEHENELIMARCILGVVPGDRDSVDLDSFVIPDAPPLSREQVHNLRNRILEPQWNGLVGAQVAVSLTLRKSEEPSAPSSPKS